MKEKYDVRGMTCAACQSHVQNAVSKVNGVNKVNVNLLKNDMVVEYDEKVCSSLDIINAVKKSGYETELQGNKLNNKNNKEEKDNSLITLIISIVDLLVLMYFGMFHMLFKAPTFDVFNMMKNPMGYSLLQFILVLPIVYLNFKYFKS